MSLSDRFDHVVNQYRRLVGGEYLGFNNAVFLSEKETAHRNSALGHYMMENRCFPDGTSLEDTLDFYFQLCSVELNVNSAAVMAATLANGGFCPITGEVSIIPWRYDEPTTSILLLLHGWLRAKMSIAFMR